MFGKSLQERGKNLENYLYYSDPFFAYNNSLYIEKTINGKPVNIKINGTRNEYHIVKQDTYPVYDGIHEAIVSVEDWELAQQKRKKLCSLCSLTH